MFIVYNIDGFVEYGKMIQQDLQARNTWNATVKDIKEKVANKLDIGEAISFMQHLNMMVRVESADRDPQPAATGGVTKREIVCFPNCYNVQQTYKLHSREYSLFIDFNDYMSVGYFVQLAEDMGSKCNGLMIMDTPYYMVMNKEGFVELHMEYVPWNALVHCHVW